MKTVRFSEPHAYPLRSFTYRIEHIKAYEVQRAIVYTGLVNSVIQMIRKNRTKITSVFEQNRLIMK